MHRGRESKEKQREKEGYRVIDRERHRQTSKQTNRQRKPYPYKDIKVLNVWHLQNVRFI